MNNPSVPLPTALPVSRRASHLRAFSLIEVTLALGVVSFGLMSVLALLPSGLKTVRESANEIALSSIARSVRAELNQASFSDVSTVLPSETWYFSQTGMRLPATAAAQDRYFAVTFINSPPQAPSTASQFSDTLQALSVKIRFPDFAPTPSQQSEVLTFHAARQSGTATGT